MEQLLFHEVADVVRTLAPQDLGEVHINADRRGIKVWFNTAKASQEHYEAQQLRRHHVDGKDGLAIEIGFHAEHPGVDANEAAIAHIAKTEKKWRKVLGAEAEVGEFYGAPNWRRISEAWLEVDFEDPELAFEVASRLVDYLVAIEPARK